jgi:hypothetical protein
LNGGDAISKDRPLKEDVAQLEVYLLALSDDSVPEEERRWYVRSVERFAAFLVEKPLQAVDRDNAEAFISSLGRRPRTNS